MRNELIELYKRIHDCHICPEMDKEKALRQHNAVNKRIDVFIISQALAESQLRRSGINFFTLEGKLGNTGKNLEKFLNLFGRTVYPPNRISLSNGIVIRKCSTGFVSVYNTEITQCFPGKNNGSDRPPSNKEVERCLERNFIDDEIGLIKPKLLLLMGDKSRKSFYKHYIKSSRNEKLGEHIDSITDSGSIPSGIINGQKVHVLPIQHASGANPNFGKMLNNERLIKMIQKVLLQDHPLLM